MLSFDEFLKIPPCTKGKHSTVDDTPDQKESQEAANARAEKILAEQKAASEAAPAPAPAPAPAVPTPTPSTQAPEEPDSDDPSLEIPAGATCRRRGCKATYDPSVPRDEEVCVHHPGQPIFHEGSKGWSCCKRRVLEFDEFMKIAGCKEKKRHLFVGKGKPDGEESIEDVR